MELTEEQLALAQELSNRSKNQSNFLYELCDFDFDKMMLVENKIKEKFLCYCPSNKEELTKLLSIN